MRKKDRLNKVIICIIIFTLIIAIVLFLDFTNCLYNISKNFNYDFLGIFSSNITLIFILFTTYYLIDKRNIEKEERINNNKLGILNSMLKKTYETCKKSLKVILNDSYVIENFITSKTIVNKKESDIIKNLQDFPFFYDDQLMTMMYDGIVDNNITDKYLEIKDLYKSYVSSKIVCHDLLNYNLKELKDLKESIMNDNKRLTKLINDELNRLDKQSNNK